MKHRENKVNDFLESLQPDPHRRGGKQAFLDRHADALIRKKEQGITYQQLAEGLEKVGFSVSAHTIAAWAKKRKRKRSPLVPTQPSIGISAVPTVAPAPTAETPPGKKHNPLRRDFSP